MSTTEAKAACRAKFGRLPRYGYESLVTSYRTRREFSFPPWGPGRVQQSGVMNVWLVYSRGEFEVVERFRPDSIFGDKQHEPD